MMPANQNRRHQEQIERLAAERRRDQRTREERDGDQRQHQDIDHPGPLQQIPTGQNGAARWCRPEIMAKSGISCWARSDGARSAFRRPKFVKKTTVLTSVKIP